MNAHNHLADYIVREWGLPEGLNLLTFRAVVRLLQQGWMDQDDIKMFSIPAARAFVRSGRVQFEDMGVTETIAIIALQYAYQRAHEVAQEREDAHRRAFEAFLPAA